VEIETLKENLIRYQKEKPKRKTTEALQKRFETIYKNFSIQERGP